MANGKLYPSFIILLSTIFLTAFNAVDTPLSNQKTNNVNVLDNGAKLRSTDCWFEAKSGQNISCGWLHTAPSDTTKKSEFQLPIVIFHYEGEDKKDDPIIYLSGGPGAGAWLDPESIQTLWAKAWEEKISPLKRDLILFDQRGSGLSKPEINCPIYKTHTTRLLTKPGTPSQNAKEFRAVTQACYNQLTKSGLPINQLSTHHSSKDVADIMQLLGHEKWNIQSVSYGTRLAIEVQRNYPEKIRTLTLDSVYPPSAHLFQDWPMLLNSSLERIFHHCETDSLCSTHSDDFRKRFWALMESLKQKPLMFEINDPTIALDHILLNDETLLAVLFQTEYRSDVLSHLTDAIFDLEKNETASLQPYVEEYVLNQLNATASDAVYWAVECHDNPEIDPYKYFMHTNKYSDLIPYLPEDNDVCEIWNKNYAYVPLNSESYVETPVLIFSGENDPVTPTVWAEDTAAAYNDQAYLFSFYGISHSVMDHKACTKTLYGNFVNDPTKRPRANCRIGDEQEEETVIAGEESIEIVTEETSREGEEQLVVSAAVSTTSASGEKRLPSKQQ